MDVESKNKIMVWTIVAFLALLLLIPASYAIKKARSIDTTIPPDTLAGLKANVRVSHTQPGQATGMEILTPGSRAPLYDNAGAALLIPVRANISTFGEKDFKFTGTAPWALLNTVAANINDPEMVRYIFNHRVVVDAFINRTDVKSLLDDPEALYNVVSDEAAVSKFFGYADMKSALSNPKIIDTVAKSMLMDAILQTPAAQYYLKNPKTAADIINKSETLSALKNNPNIADAVKTNRRTAPVSSILLQ